jgi:enoyl-CoA hydratase/carnithine racemase
MTAASGPAASGPAPSGPAPSGPAASGPVPSGPGAPAAVAWERTGPGVLRIILQRPPANALGVPLVDGLNRALDDASADRDIKIIVVVSEVPGFFAAGADIKHMATADAAAFAAYGNALRAVLGRLAAPDWISIAAVEGLALGGGLELALACTLRVAGAGARFGLPEVKLGLIPGAGGTQRLPRLVGRDRALDIMLTGRQVGAEEAHAIGLISRLAAAGQAETEALRLAGELGRASRPAQRAVIRTVDASYETSLADGLAYERGQVEELFEAGEAKEGITAFLEKRPPNFSR